MKKSESTVAVIAILVSFSMASASWWYNRELSRAAISLVEVKVDAKRSDKDKLKISFLFIFENTGRETLKITELDLGHADFKRPIFEQVGKTPILNPIHGGAIFNHSLSFGMPIAPEIPDEAIGDILPKIIGKHAIILRLKFKGSSIFSRKEIVEKYYLGYEGFGAVYQLTMDEYEKIETVLPQEFQVDE